MSLKNVSFDTLIESRILWGVLITAIFLVAMAVIAIVYLEETKELLLLLKNSDAGWMIIAILVQIPTYIFTGIVWHLSARAANYHLTMKSLTELAFKQLGVNQIIPAGGLAGNFIVFRAMKRFGLPTALAMEIFFIETLSQYIAFSLVAFISVMMLWLYHGVTPIISGLVSIFFAIQVTVIILIWAAVNHKKLKFLSWLKSKKFFFRLFSVIENVSEQRVFSAQLLFETSFFRLGIFLFDTFTLFAILHSIGAGASLSTAFVAFIVASMAGTVVALPGGVGGFEAASIGILNLLGIPLGAAVAATFIFRALTLWLPLVPGLILAREDLGLKK